MTDTVSRFLVFRYPIPNSLVAPRSPSASSPAKPPRPYARKRPGGLPKVAPPGMSQTPAVSLSGPSLVSRRSSPSQNPATSVPRPHPDAVVSVAGPSSSRMSTYAIDPKTGAQSTIPAMSVLTPSTAGIMGRGKGKGKGKDSTTPVVPTAPMTSRVGNSTKPDMEEAGKHFLCYRGDRHLACANCIKLDIPCVNVLNQQLDRLVCQNCKKRKIQCTASEDSRAVIAKVKSLPPKPALGSATPTPRRSRKRSLEEMGEFLGLVVLPC
jgi:hypothetical protein